MVPMISTSNNEDRKEEGEKEEGEGNNWSCPRHLNFKWFNINLCHNLVEERGQRHSRMNGVSKIEKMPSFKERWERWPWFNKLVSVISNVLRKTSFCFVEYIFGKMEISPLLLKGALKSGKLLVQVVEPANNTKRSQLWDLVQNYWLCPMCVPHPPYPNVPMWMS